MCYICFFCLCLYTHASFSCFIYGKHSRFCKNIPERHQPNHCTPSTFEIASPIKYEQSLSSLNVVTTGSRLTNMRFLMPAIQQIIQLEASNKISGLYEIYKKELGTTQYAMSYTDLYVYKV